MLDPKRELIIPQKEVSVWIIIASLWAIAITRVNKKTFTMYDNLFALTILNGEPIKFHQIFLLQELASFAYVISLLLFVSQFSNV
jgi:hypothetical protein